MDYVQAGIKGDFTQLAGKSFDCIQCGLCAIRCPAEIVQYNVAQLGRRIYGRYAHPEPEHLTKRLKEIEEGKFNQEMEEVTQLSRAELEKLYAQREAEREEA